MSHESCYQWDRRCRTEKRCCDSPEVRIFVFGEPEYQAALPYCRFACEWQRYPFNKNQGRTALPLELQHSFRRDREGSGLTEQDELERLGGPGHGMVCIERMEMVAMMFVWFVE